MFNYFTPFRRISINLRGLTQHNVNKNKANTQLYLDYDHETLHFQNDVCCNCRSPKADMMNLQKRKSKAK